MLDQRKLVEQLLLAAGLLTLSTWMMACGQEAQDVLSRAMGTQTADNNNNSARGDSTDCTANPNAANCIAQQTAADNMCEPLGLRKVAMSSQDYATPIVMRKPFPNRPAIAQVGQVAGDNMYVELSVKLQADTQQQSGQAQRLFGVEFVRHGSAVGWDRDFPRPSQSVSNISIPSGTMRIVRLHGRVFRNETFGMRVFYNKAIDNRGFSPQILKVGYFTCEP